MLASRIFFSKSLAHFSPSFPHLSGGGSVTYLPWIHRELTDEGSLKKCFLFSALSDGTRFHISEKFYRGAFLTIATLFHHHFPISTSDFCCCNFSPACPGYSSTALSAAGKQFQHFTTLGLCLSQETVLKTHYWIVCFSMYKQPCCHS